MAAVIYRFASFRLDPAKRELEDAGTLLALTPQVFDCITYLIEHRDRAVGRDELISAVWGRADVSDTLLAQTIMHARRAVGDSGEAQQRIRTIPRFGYRWVDEEISVEAPVAEASAGSAPATRRRLLSLALLLAAVATLVTIRWPGGERGPIPGAQALGLEPLLILPVATAVTPETSWIPLGLMDSIAVRLRNSGWSVVPSSTVVALTHRDDAPLDTDELARTTGAGLVVRPHAQRDRDGWAVHLELLGSRQLPARVDARSGDVLDAGRLASERLVALLRREPLPESVGAEPDAEVAELVQRIEAELLAQRYEAAQTLLAAMPEAWRTRPELRFQQAQLDYRSGHLARAEEGFRTLLEAPSAGDPARIRGRAWAGLGSIARTRVRFDEAVGHYHQALELLDTEREPGIAGMIMAELGVSLGSLGRFDEANRTLAQARVILEGTGDAIGVAVVDAGFAIIQADRRRLPEAAERIAGVIERFDRLGAGAEAFDKRIALVQMRRELLEIDAALAVSAAMWARVAADRSQRLFPMAVAMRAQVLIDAGQYGAAEALLSQLPDPDRAEADRGYQWRQVGIARARLLLARGQAAEAEAVLAALDGGADPGAETGELWLWRARALRALGREVEVRALLARVAAWATGDERYRQVMAALIHAEADAAADDWASASEAYAKALQGADELAVPFLIATIARSWGNALIDAGQPAQAVPVVGRVALWAESDYESALLEVRLFHALGQPGAWRKAIERARRLAGERVIPATLSSVPAAAHAGAGVARP